MKFAFGKLEIGRMMKIRRKHLDGSVYSQTLFLYRVLDCDNFTTVWVVWNDDGRVSMGTTANMSEENILLSFQDSEPFDIRGVGIKTDYNTDGIWRMTIDGKYYT